MGSYASSLSDLINPSEQYDKFEAHRADIKSNKLQDIIREHQGEIAKSQSAQEAIKTEQINHAWEAQKAYAEGMRKFTKLVPADGYTDQPEAASQNGTSLSSRVQDPNSTSPNPSIGMLQSALHRQSGVEQAATSDGSSSTLKALTAGGVGGFGGPRPGLDSQAVPSTAAAPTLKRMNPNDPATYRVEFDKEGFRNHLVGLGFGPEADKADAERQKAATAVTESYIKAHELAQKKMEGISNILAAVPLTDFNESDPQKLQQQQQDSQTGALKQLRFGVQNGLIDPQQEKGLEQQIMSQPWSPQMQQQVQAMANSATAADKQHAEMLDTLKEHDAEQRGKSLDKERESQTAERDVATSQKRLTTGAQAAGSIKDQASMDAWYNGLSPEGQKQFADVYKRGYSRDTVSSIKAMGQTEEQRAQEVDKGRTATETARHNRATEARANASEESAPALTKEGMAVAAKLFRKTGTLPPMGIGKAGAKLRADIINNAAAQEPELDIADAKAAYHANSESLKKIQGNTDSVTAFESTAGKNLDLLLKNAKPIIDSGSQWINKPLRAIDQKALGNTDLIAFNAARQVAVNEIAKVTSNPGLTGQLSDTARKEVEAFIPQDATLKQTLRVAEILRKDMKNRLDSNNEQIEAIRNRIKGITDQHPSVAAEGGEKPSGGGAAATHRFNLKTGKIEEIKK